MRIKSKTKYPDNWDELSSKRKAEEKYRCERCGHPDDRKSGHVLTVHHLDGDKSNNEKWNLAVLCQRCHLYMQATVIMDQMLFDFVEVSEWFKPHLDGFKRSRNEKVN